MKKNLITKYLQVVVCVCVCFSVLIRSFKPDFALVRQNLRDAGENYKNLLLGLMYGSVPSVNNLSAIYNFQVSQSTGF